MLISSYFYIGNSGDPPKVDKIYWSLDIRYCGGPGVNCIPESCEYCANLSNGC